MTYGSGGYYATSLAVADVNGDGKPDLLVANECAIGSNCGSSGKVGVLLGNGDGTFQAPVTYSSGGQFPYSLAVGDVNGDGKPDLVVTNLYENSGSTNGSLGVLLGNGDGTFRKGSTTMIPAYGLGAIVFSDFNGDGKLDVALGDGYGDGILLLGNGNGTFQSFMTLGAGGFGIAAGDFNLDGKPDLAVGGVAVLLNITGEATTTTLFSSHNPSSLNQRTTFTATVSSPVGIPAGKVTFMNGTTALATKTLIGGAASFATSNLPAGMNSITAVYGGGRGELWRQHFCGGESIRADADCDYALVFREPIRLWAEGNFHSGGNFWRRRAGGWRDRIVCGGLDDTGFEEVERRFG